MFKKLPLKERIQIADKLKECEEPSRSSSIFEKVMKILVPVYDIDLCTGNPIDLSFDIIETLIAHKIEEADFQTIFDIVILNNQNQFDRDQYLIGIPDMINDAKQMLPLILHYTYYDVKMEQEKKDLNANQSPVILEENSMFKKPTLYERTQLAFKLKENSMFKKLPLYERIQIAFKLKECSKYGGSSSVFEKVMKILTPMHKSDFCADDLIDILFSVVEILIAYKIEEKDFQTVFNIVIVNKQNKLDQDNELKGIPNMIKDAKQMLSLILHYTYYDVKTEKVEQEKRIYKRNQSHVMFEENSMFKALPLQEQEQISVHFSKCTYDAWSIFIPIMKVLTPEHQIHRTSNTINLTFDIIEGLISYNIKKEDFQTVFDIIIASNQREFDQDNGLKGIPIMIKVANQMLPLILHYTYDYNLKTEIMQKKDLNVNQSFVVLTEKL